MQALSSVCRASGLDHLHAQPFGDQGRLDLGDLSEVPPTPVAANDDPAPARSRPCAAGR